MSGGLVSGSSVAWLRSEWKHGEGTLAASYASPCRWGRRVCVALTPPHPSFPATSPRYPSSAVKAVACQSFFRVTFSLEMIGHRGRGCVPLHRPLSRLHHHHHPVASVNSRTCFAREAFVFHKNNNNNTFYFL